MSGTLFVIGTGPGNSDLMCGLALEALSISEVVVGYKTYISLIAGLIEGKQVYSNGMRREKERCEQAIECAREGKTTALISGGDPGIYAMAGLVLEMAEKNHIEIEVEIIPGISALQAAAALLGAPIMHDFAVVSLSDLLTPWEVITKRLDAAGKGDFVICIYNPSSTTRAEHFPKARQILLTHKNESTPVGVVKNAYRDNQEVIITTLGECLDIPLDMATLVIIGNSNTYSSGGKMITPRGYTL